MITFSRSMMIRWTKERCALLADETHPIHDFLENFLLVAQQLEFVASQVGEISASLAQGVTTWCSAEYGWTRHLQTLNQKKFDLKRKKLLVQANSDSVKQQMLTIGEKDSAGGSGIGLCYNGTTSTDLPECAPHPLRGSADPRSNTKKHLRMSPPRYHLLKKFSYIMCKG